MQFLQTNFLHSSKTFTVLLISIALLVTPFSFCLSSEKEELAAAKSLIAIIESGNAGQIKQAETLFASILANSSLKPIAAYALALVQIRELQFSEAWKSLTTPWKNPAAVPDSVKIGKERLKLWLLLEAGKPVEAESQFNQLVTISLALDSASGDQEANCGLIGGVVGMLQVDTNAPCIPLLTLEKAKELILTKVKSKNAKAKMEEQLHEAGQWGADLSALVSKFESIGIEKANEQNTSTQSEIERTKQAQLELRGDLKSAGVEKRDLEGQSKKLKQYGNSILAQWNTVTPGKPIYPNPGPRPSPPIEPRGTYNIDPKTQARKNVPPSDFDMRKFRKEEKEYEKRHWNWQQSVNNLQRDLDAYPAKLQRWEQFDAERRAALKSQKDAIDSEYAKTEKALNDKQENIKQGVGGDLKQTSERLEQMERFAAISSVALRHVASNDPKAKHLIRPSNFQLLDFMSESARMRKALR